MTKPNSILAERKKHNFVAGAVKKSALASTVDYRRALVEQLSRDLIRAAAYLEEVVKSEDYETLKIAVHDVIDALRSRSLRDDFSEGCKDVLAGRVVEFRASLRDTKKRSERRQKIEPAARVGDIAVQLARARAASGLDETAMAAKAGLLERDILNMEAGKGSIRGLELYAAALGCRVELVPLA